MKKNNILLINKPRPIYSHTASLEAINKTLTLSNVTNKIRLKNLTDKINTYVLYGINYITLTLKINKVKKL